MIVVTKVGAFPASNSTLYFEQAVRQIDTVISLGIFGMAIRLVGLTINVSRGEVKAFVSKYGARYRRASQERKYVRVPVRKVGGRFEFDLPTRPT